MSRLKFDSEKHQTLAYEFINQEKIRENRQLQCTICKSREHLTAFCPKLEICFIFNSRYKKPCPETCKLKHICAICEDDTHGACEHADRHLCNHFNTPNGCSKMGNTCSYDHKCKVCDSPKHNSFNCHLAYFEVVQTHKQDLVNYDTCKAYNHKIGCERNFHCKQAHFCQFCKHRHAAFDCLSLKAITCFNYNIVFREDKAICNADDCIYMHACMICGDKGHKSFECSLNRVPDKLCINYNKKSGCERYSSGLCIFMHSCKACNGNHSAWNCPAQYKPLHKKFIEKVYLYKSSDEKHKVNMTGMPMQNCPNSYEEYYNAGPPLKKNRKEVLASDNGSIGSASTQQYGQYGNMPLQAQCSKQLAMPTVAGHVNSTFNNGLQQQAQSSCNQPLPLNTLNNPGQINQMGHGHQDHNQLMSGQSNGHPHSGRPQQQQVQAIGRNVTNLVTNVPSGEIIQQMEYSIIINGVEWSGILTRKN